MIFLSTFCTFPSRLEREKLMLEGRAKAASRDLNSQTNVLIVKIEELKVENLRLKDELAAVSHNTLMEGEQGLETLKLRNKFLLVHTLGSDNQDPILLTKVQSRIF